MANENQKRDNHSGDVIIFNMPVTNDVFCNWNIKHGTSKVVHMKEVLV